MSRQKLPPIHPGRILREEFMAPLELSQNELARALGVDPGRVNQIVTERRSVSADTALRLARYFGSTPEFWLNLQKRYDLECARAALLEEIEATVKPREQPRASAVG